MPESEVSIQEISYLNKKSINDFISKALKEDIGDGDHSTLSTISEDNTSKAYIVAKDEGVIAGIVLAKMIFAKVDPELKVVNNVEDGDWIRVGDIVLEIEGRVRGILSAERLVLNCMQRMSGIATKTRKYADLIKNFKAKLLDTRKTTPNFRMLEKWAVKIGGGENHRFGLYDMIMLKDNHIDFAGSISKALNAAVKYRRDNDLTNIKIEVETRTISEVQEAVNTGGADIIMLDNMMPSVMKEAVAIIGNRAVTEASGGVKDSNIQEIAETGVDFISVGALTHSYTSLDLSLKASSQAS